MQFGEKALFRLAYTIKKEKEDSKWVEGVFLGVLDVSSEYIWK